MSQMALSGPIAVIDVETTGLFPFRNDRVVEVAAVVVRSDGSVEREFVTLVNPGRDIGPSSIHGLTSEDIVNAPLFADIAALLVDALHGTVAIAGHNVRFDKQFLESEFSRIGCTFPECHSICTMRLAGGRRLVDCCADYAIPLEGQAHEALTDARAASRLLTALLSDSTCSVRELTALKPISWPAVPRLARHPITRDESRRILAEPPNFLQRLLGRVHETALSIAIDDRVMAYEALLDRALEDRRIDASEADALVETASRWGLSGDQIRQAHRDYLNQLVVAALADGVITELERRDLKLVARLLGFGHSNLDELLNQASSRVSEACLVPSNTHICESSLVGKRVCFTGEMQAIHQGRAISREYAEELATKAGLEVMDSVTKRLDLLVVADPYTQSGKASKARKYGIRIMHEPVFWKELGVTVS